MKESLTCPKLGGVNSHVGPLITGFCSVVENIILGELGVPSPLSAWFFMALVGEHGVLVGER